MGGRQGHSCLTRRDDGPQERDADPLRALQLDVGPRARGAARLQPERSRTAQPARRSQRGAAAQAACAAQPRGRDALCAAAARMRRASSCANARQNRGEPASTDSSRGAAARAGRLDGDTRRGRCVGRAFLCAALECVGARSLYSWERRSFDHRSHAFLCPPRSRR